MIQLNINNNKNNYKRDHDHVKGSKLTFFCVLDKVVSSSQLLRSFEFAITMQCWKRKTS